jgi:predicted dehydrogenase
MEHDELRIGVVGAGGIAPFHIGALKAAGVDIFVYSERGAHELAAAHDVALVTTYDDLVAAVDVIDIITPTPTHVDYACRALEHGKDVIVEKPLALTVDDAERIQATALRAGRTVLPAHVLRYFPEFAALHETVRSGRLGTLAALRFSRAGASPAKAGTWFSDRAQSGGVVMDQMIHDMDVARWLAGDVTRVSAVRRSGTGASAGVEAAHVLLTHAGGAISQVSGFWGPPHLTFATEYCVAGTGGTVSHASQGQRRWHSDLSSETTTGGSLVPEVDPADDPYRAEILDFVRSLRSRTPAAVSLEDGVEAVRMADAALRSIATGLPVDLPRSREHD